MVVFLSMFLSRAECKTVTKKESLCPTSLNTQSYETTTQNDQRQNITTVKFRVYSEITIKKATSTERQRYGTFGQYVLGWLRIANINMAD